MLIFILGRCYPRETLEGLMRFCNRHKIHLISDEIYALSVYNSDETHISFTSVLSINPSGIIDPNLVHVLYGMSTVRSSIQKPEIIDRLTVLPLRISLPQD
jgi:hypothetical protein